MEEDKEINNIYKHYIPLTEEQYKEYLNLKYNSVSKDKIRKIIKQLDVDIERNRRREINNAKDGTYKMSMIAYDPEIIKMVLLELLERGE